MLLLQFEGEEREYKERENREVSVVIEFKQTTIIFKIYNSNN